MKPATLATLAVLRRRGPTGLTSNEAIPVVGTSRLAARVGELRAEGYPVETRWERTPAGARIARYVLAETPRFAPVTGVQEALL
jgi:hypothetical protein